MTQQISKIQIEQNILELAKQNDFKALEIMFQQFIGSTEKIQFMEYLGQQGFILNLSHSFVCVTEKRIISLNVGSFGKILYQDAFIEDLNSSIIYQPSILGLYVTSIFLIIATLVTALYIGLPLTRSLFWPFSEFTSYLITIGVMICTLAFIFFIMLPFVVRVYYKINKCGMVFSIKEGISVYIFANRSRLNRANVMWRICAQLREERIEKFHKN
jgi:hypothetical protein